ncbi:MAG: hypothetical protein U0694_05750 [Anaerolineae bacterium]
MLKNLNLRAKLALGFAVPLILLILNSLLASYTSNQLEADLLDVNNFSVPIIQLLEEVKFAGSRVISSANELILDHILAAQFNLHEDESSQITTAIDDLMDPLHPFKRCC